jgi:hypothetical protein
MSAIATFWWHDDIVALQKTLDADLESTNASVAACTALSDTARTAWESFYTNAKAYTQSSAAWVNTGTQADRGQELQRELLAKQQQLTKSCSNVSPAADPDKGKPADLSTYFKWGAVIAGVIGVAYVTGQVASTVRLFKSPSSAKE